MSQEIEMSSTFGQRLKTLRKRSALTQQGLAAAAGLSISALTKAEAGQTEPTWDTVQRLARALGVKTDDFRDDEPTGEAEQPASEKPKKKPKK